MDETSLKQTDAQQLLDMSALAATFLSRCLLDLSLRVFGFAPRQRRHISGCRLNRMRRRRNRLVKASA